MNVVSLGVVTLSLNYSHFVISPFRAKVHIVFEGTSEIQQIVIARAISGLRIE